MQTRDLREQLLRYLPQEAEARSGAGVLRRAAALPGGDGGLRGRSLLGPGDRSAWSPDAADRAGLRQAVREAPEERHGRRGGDLRGGAAADDAVRHAEERRDT